MQDVLKAILVGATAYFGYKLLSGGEPTQQEEMSFIGGGNQPLGVAGNNAVKEPVAPNYVYNIDLAGNVPNNVWENPSVGTTADINPTKKESKKSGSWGGSLKILPSNESRYVKNPAGGYSDTLNEQSVSDKNVLPLYREQSSTPANPENKNLSFNSVNPLASNVDQAIKKAQTKKEKNSEQLQTLKESGALELVNW